MSAGISALIDRYLDTLVEDYPSYATHLGIHRHDGELGDYSRDGFEERHAHVRALLRDLEALPVDDADSDDAIDREILRAELRHSVFTHETLRPHVIQPSTYVRNAIGGCHSLTIKDFAPIEERASNLLSRLRQVPGVLEAMERNIASPPRVFARVGSEAAMGGIAFIRSVVPGVGEAVPSLKTDLAAASDAAAAAFERAAEYLAELAEGGPESLHIGRKSYEWLLREYHMLDYDSEGLRDMGWAVVRETKSRMAEVAGEVEAGADWESVLEKLKADHPPKGKVRETYASEMARARDFVVENDLVTVPDGERLEVIDTPVFIRNIIPYAAYLPPGPFEDEQLGFFYVTPVDEALPDEEQERQLRGHALHTIPVVALHEAYPGHHLQLIRANAGAHKLRKLVWSTVYGEGWALYCEEMMKEAGFYSDARTRLCQLKENLWRAARVVVDVGLQLGEMSVEDGIEFMMREVHLERVNATAEVRRYAAMPTQPSSYMIGKRAIMALREKAQARDGDAFDLKAFHDSLLDLGNLQPRLAARSLGLTGT